MNYLASILLMFLTACENFDPTMFSDKLKFDQIAHEHLFDSSLKIYKVKNDSEEIKTIKVAEIRDLPSTLAELSVELKDQAIVHWIEYSDNEPYKVYEEVIKKIAKEKNCDVVVYVEADNVYKYELYNDRKTLKIRERDGFHYFQAFFFSKVKLHKTHDEDYQ